MKIDILCSDMDHPVIPWLHRWMTRWAGEHDIALLGDKAELSGGDILFMVSCTQIVEAELRTRYRHAMVLHASDLPSGRGWSPHVWAILEGAETITVSLIDAEDAVDSGAIWAKKSFAVPRTALYDEINSAIFDAEVSLMSHGVKMVEEGVSPVPQVQSGASYYPRRTPADSELDPARPLEDMFDQIRVADPERYPAFFRMFGQTYTIELKKVERDE